MASLHLLSPLVTQNISSPLVILVVAIGIAGVAILILFAKDKI